MSKKLNVKIKAIGLLDLLAFKKLVPNRKKKFEEAPATEIRKTPPMNELAAKLHPKHQKFTITDVVELTSSMKQFELSSDTAAYFRAGQYVSVKLDINGHKVTRPYSIMSSPKAALSGKYMLGVKKADDGFVTEYIFDNWKEGTVIETSGPEGNFYYEDIRDAKTIIGIAGGCGITPFFSMAQAIRDGIEDFNLCLLYGCKTLNDIALRKELDVIAQTDSRVKVVYVLSDEKKEGYEHGFITADVIKKYAGDEPYSIFMCGPQVMYDFISKEIAKLGLEKKYVRRELYGQINNVEKYEGFPKDKVGKKYKLTIHMGQNTTITEALSTESILVAVERAKIKAPSLCRTGECGCCRSRLIAGDVFIVEDTDGRRMADKKFGYVHICSSFPLSDLEIEIPVE
ncbi:MAG: iron-sulfur cluster-binding domain-containing protein [Clostridia bacterium]|mgnify:CR=1 FL=1|jgi:ferredoxin-NADP reductase|nr:iron-sulfur cluster-binding domain-containing protein [Clostridia bacterium]MDD3092963.1 iron-sulfur cluster-binding domain-containing protein [Clostridia bacterium]MDD3971955.1 iron-sulfur cluster-binding domain-containing protein [Clostridia bacterium]MDD4542318.1 iron-sulfur cluster-binding domain-containing protein [Clostridia bacterium]